MRHRLLKIVAAVLFGLVLLEGGLQVMAIVAAVFSGRDDVVAGEPVILCVGDSVTWGLGAERDEAWPARVAAALRATYPELGVVNDARPGQTSADVIERFGPRLESLRPDLVCILCGWNDTWSRPPLVTAMPEGRGTFRWRFRTWRLLQLAFAADPSRPESDAAASTTESDAGTPPFVGVWHIAGEDFLIAADGTAWFGGLPARWTRTTRGVRLEHDDPTVEPYELRIRIRIDGTLEVQHPRWSRFVRARRGLAAERTPLEVAADLAANERSDDALAVLRAALDGPHAIEARAALALATPDAAERGHLREALETDRADPESPAATSAALAEIAFEEGRHADGTALVLASLDRDPTRIATWELALTHGDARLQDALRSRLDALLAATAPSERARRGAFELLASRVAIDAPNAVGHLLAAIDAGVGVTEATETIAGWITDGHEPTAILAAMDALPADRPGGSLLRRALRRATADDADVLATLGRHLELLVDFALARGADVVLLGYPFDLDGHDDLVGGIAAARGLPFVALRPTFDQLLTREPRAHWFVDPIHPNARGYAEMARVIEPVVAERLRRRARGG